MKTFNPHSSSPKVLIAYYSYTGFTARIAEEIAHAFDFDFDCDMERIKEHRPRRGWWGYLRCVYEVMRKKCPGILPLDVDVSAYDLVIIGTPVWAHHAASPLRTFLRDQRSKIRRTAFFCTFGGAGEAGAFDEMARVSGKRAIATLAVTDTQIGDGSYSEKLNEFVASIEREVPYAAEPGKENIPAILHSQKIQSIRQERLGQPKP